jgi:hypothetical protein
MGAASFKSLYQKRPVWHHATAQGCVAGRSRYSTKVGSRTGAVFRRFGLAVAPRFLWECLNIQTVNPFPAPATSHPACGFPALGAPVCFVPRVMWPIVLGRLSHLTIDGAGSC